VDGGSREGGLADIFRAHFGHREHLYGVLLDELADDLEAGGLTAQICRDHLDAPRDEAIQLRLLAAIFRIVLPCWLPMVMSCPQLWTGHRRPMRSEGRPAWRSDFSRRYADTGAAECACSNPAPLPV
jgi:hypothetical protein